MRFHPLLAESVDEARNPDLEAAKAPDGTPTKTHWRYLASSWRLLAERIISERTGGELPFHRSH